MPRTVTLFGRPGHTFAVERSTHLTDPIRWELIRRLPHTNLAETVIVGNAEPLGFYRAFEFESNPPLLESPRIGSPLLLYGQPGVTYLFQYSPAIGADATWTILESFTLSNSFRFLVPTNTGALNRFYRTIKP